MANKQHHIIYFPHLTMRDVPEIDFGFMKIWNFKVLKEKYIPDEKLRSKIEKIFSSYQEYFRGQIKDIGIVSIGTMDFRVFTQEEKADVRLARLILFLSFVSKANTIPFNGNTGHQMASSENFNEVYQNFTLEDDHMAESGGYIAPYMHGGFVMGEIKHIKPSFIPSPGKFDIDANLFNSLLELKDKKPKVFERITNATELLFESYYNSHIVSINARVLLQMSALEILLDLSEAGQRKHFKEIIEKETILPEDKRRIHYSERPNGKKAKEALTLKGVWGDLFYTLRNHIIHGLTPKNEEYGFMKKQRHTEIAFLFFILFVKKQVNKSLKKDIFSEEIQWKKWHDNNFEQDREEFVIETSFRKLFNKLMKQKKKQNGR